MDLPEDLKYTKEHEWARVEGDVVVVGITDYAQNALGDITFVELPEVGAKVKADAEVCVVESVKAASDVYSPLSGEVAEVNTALNNSPELINSAPYGNGWLFKIKNFNRAQLDNLLSTEEYGKQIEEA